MVHGDERSIKGKVGSKVMGVRLSGERVLFRYHSTDVVVWCPDNSYAVDLTYDSQSTGEFARRFVPAGHNPVHTCKGYEIGDRVYPGIGVVRVGADGSVDTGNRVFSRRKINRARAKVLLDECGYREFAEWCSVMKPMLTDEALNTMSLYLGEVVALLRSPPDYHTLLLSRFGNLDVLRKEIYDLSPNEAYERVQKPHLPPMGSMSKWSVEWV
jgi:hypothetical protein